MSKKILYHSTNRQLPTSFKKRVDFREALFSGIAPDGGLFMPARIPRLSKQQMFSLKGKSYSEVAHVILGVFLNQEITSRDLKTITKDAYNFKVPLEKIDDSFYLMRLDRGPTASFKDFAARFMARAMQKMKERGKKITILVATSGDTGSAIGESYKGLKDINVFILYPAKEVSSVQKKQLDSIGGNVQAIAVDGKFDDCQKLVKAAFLDPDLKDLNLVAANSINIGRILPQIVYYFYAYVNTAKMGQPVIFSIPSGNFGNSLGCEIARRMGLPIEKIIIAVNTNDEFPRFLSSGRYQKIEPSRVGLSNAMNVGNPSNLARFFDLYGGILDRVGIVRRRPRLAEMKKNFYSVSISNALTIGTIKEIYKKCSVIIEPHGAVGIAALEKYYQNNKMGLAICLETAHPAKFPEVIRQELRLNPKLPPALRRASTKVGRPDALVNDYQKFKKYLLEKYDKMD